jgi:hypothetical protein
MSKYKRLVPDLELKPCPYCGGSDIRYSIKTTTISFERAYHLTMYCWNCNCYGPRTLYKCGKQSENRVKLEMNTDFYTQAAEAWNRRAGEHKDEN